ncbi:glycosyl transferase [Arthrobacter sp. JZ12]|uniref:glycosyl transferase n=1 Tax=Arthrobacter sp. JZ12 TaxID=2654190 RepID=UPI003A5CFAF7
MLTASREVFEYQTGIDSDLEKTIDPRIDIIRVPFNSMRSEPNLVKWSRTRVSSNLLWSYLSGQKDRISFPEPVYGGWRHALVSATDQVQRTNPIDLVLGTANPNVDFVPGWHLHKKAGVPYVMDYRDAWHLDVFSGQRVGSHHSWSARLEKRYLEHAAEAWFVNAAIRAWHVQEHPDRAHKFRVVANAFDEVFASSFRGMQPRANNTHSGGLIFGYLGTIYGPIPLRECLDGWRMARSRSDLLEKSRLVFRGRLGHYSDPDPKVLALLNAYAKDGVSYEGPVSKTEVATVYSQFDALLLALAGSKYVTSGKVFEYAATGLPIASVHDPQSAASTVLQDRNDWYPVSEVSAQAACEVFLKTAARATQMTAEDYARNQEWASHLTRERQLLPRIRHLEESVIRKDQVS